MEETHYHAKRMRPLGKRRVAALAAVLVLLLGIAAAGVRYFDFVSRTVYEESTAHLVEVLHQSNKMLNETVNKNMTYLHIWSSSLQHLSDERVTAQLKALSRPTKTPRRTDFIRFTDFRAGTRI